MHVSNKSKLDIMVLACNPLGAVSSGHLGSENKHKELQKDKVGNEHRSPWQILSSRKAEVKERQ